MTKQERLKRLAREGWKERFVACEPRLSEAVETYKEAGLDVHLEPMRPSKETTDCEVDRASLEKCRRCFNGEENKYKIIFTRPGEKADGFGNGLF